MAWLQLLLFVVIAIALPGCAVVGGFFKAGALVGVLAVVLVLAIIAFVVAKVAS